MIAPVDPGRLRAELYALLHTGTPGDLRFYGERCEGVDSVLELGVGDARLLARLLERSPTVSGVGLDLDPDSLRLAEDRCAPFAPRVELLREDMADFALDRRFDRVLIPFNGLLCLAAPALTQACLDSVARHLHPEGQLWFDIYAVHDLPEEEGADDDEEEQLVTLEWRDQVYDIFERSLLEPSSQCISATYRFVPRSEEAAVEHTIVQRYWTAEQLLAEFDGGPLDVFATYGDFNRSPFGDEAEHLIVGARLRGA
ncbi:MAG: class I SAM-dependent methyltransferase [Myxococcota bacterium]